jgi:hypothetical protein
MTRSSEPWFKTSSIVGNGGTFVAGLQLNGWNFGDANIQSEHTQSNGATGVLTPTSAFRSFPSSNSSISPTSDNIDAPVSSNDLSRGVTVKVIAGVSAGILGIGIFLLTFFLFRRKKRKQIVEEHGLRAEQSFVESRKSFKFVKPHIPVARQEMPT